MNNKDYEQKKQECWKEAIQGYSYNPKVLGLMRKAFDYAFDSAYAIGKQTETITQEEVGKAANEYANSLCECGMYDKETPATKEDMAYAFKAGANYALGKQAKDAEEISSLEDEIHIYAKAYSFTVEDYTAIRKAVEFGVSLAESDADAVIQGWVARDSNSDLFIYNYKPKRDTRWDSVEIWNGETYIELDSNLFPDLTWKTAPLEVEIIIKRKKNG